MLLVAFAGSVAHAQTMPNNLTQSLTVGNDHIQVTNGQVSIGFSSNMSKVGWKIYKFDGSHITNVELHVYSVKQYTNTYGPSIGLVLRGDHIQVGELYIMYKGTIDSIISFQNQDNHNITYMAEFNIYMGLANDVSLYGNGHVKDTVANLHSSSANYLVSSTTWGIMSSSLSVNWMQERSIYHSGVLTNNFGALSLSLPFGPVTLASNETYTIDPLINDQTNNVHIVRNSYSKIVTSPGDPSLTSYDYITSSTNARIGTILITVNYVGSVPDQTYIGPTIAASFSPYNNDGMGVNYVQQQYVWTGNSINSPDISLNLENSYYQNYQNSNPLVMQAAQQAFQFLEGYIPAPIPQILAFIQWVNSLDHSNGLIDGNLGYQITDNAGLTSTGHGGAYYDILQTTWYTYFIIPHSIDSFMFGDQFINEYTNPNYGSQSNPVWNYYSYQVNMKVASTTVSEAGAAYSNTCGIDFSQGQYV